MSDLFIVILVGEIAPEIVVENPSVMFVPSEAK